MSRCVGVALLVAMTMGVAPTAQAAAAPKKVRYTLTAIFDGHQQSLTQSSDAYLGPSWSWLSRNTGYVVRSVRPFWLWRWPARPAPLFQFNTQVKGRLSHWGYWWFSGHTPPDPNVPPDPPRWSWEQWQDPRVDGKVFASGSGREPLRFDIAPKFTARELLLHSSTGELGYGTGIWFRTKGKSKPFDWAKDFGKSFSITYAVPSALQLDGTTESSSQVWTFRFTPTQQQKPDVQRWEVDVSGTARDLWGYATGVRAGVWVDWKVRTVLGIEDGKLTSKTSRLAITGVREYSEPPGGFRVPFRKEATQPYEPRATKSGDSIALNLWKGDASTYRVHFDVKAAGHAQLVDALRRWGAVDPEASYRKLVADAPQNVLAFDLVPQEKIVVRLGEPPTTLHPDSFDPYAPCTANGIPVPDCFLARGGERVSVFRLK